MVRYRGVLAGGTLLGLLVLASDGRADEAAAVKAVQSWEVTSRWTPSGPASPWWP